MLGRPYPHQHLVALPRRNVGAADGEQYGLFVLPTGELLNGAINGVGLFNWNPDPKAWVRGSFRWVFTTYGPAAPFNGGPHTLDVPAGYYGASAGRRDDPRRHRLVCQPHAGPRQL